MSETFIAPVHRYPRKGSAFRTLPGVPRWARLAAYAAALTTVPSGLWRIAIAVGVPVGLGQPELDAMHAPGWGAGYLIVLSVLAEAVALLTLGLIQPWGETWPRWIPFAGGRRVPVLAAVVPASLGSMVVTIFGGFLILESMNTEVDATAWGHFLINLSYAPLLLWGPLLTVVTVHYYFRRQGDL